MPLGALIYRLSRSFAAQRRNSVRDRTDHVRLGLARLEDRVVLDGAGLVVDLQPGSGSSNPANLTQFGGSYYFTADGVDAGGNSVGRELFRLDADGSVTLVADINAGAAGSDPSDFAVFDPNGDSRMLFAATGPLGRELYQIDSTGAVSLVFDINPGTASSSPMLLTEFSGKLYFSAFAAASGREAYVVNNGGQVSLIADLNPGAASSDPSALFQFAGNLYFSAEVSGSRFLFREAPSGTSDPVLINLGTGVTDPRDFVTFGDKLYFSALDPADGRELFAMTVSGNGRETVTKVANLDGSLASSSPGDFFVFENNLYFTATTADGRELFRVSSTGTISQLDLNPGPTGSSPTGFVAFQGDMYFAATVGGTRGLWRLDTSTSALAAVAVPLPAGVTLPQEAVFYSLANELFFAADGPAGRELYRLTAGGGVTLAADVNAGPASSSPAEVILLGGKIYFVATEAGAGRELFFLRRESSSIRIDGNRLIFNDDAGDKDNRLVISSTGTHLVIVDENGHSVAILTPIAGAAGDGTSQVVIPLASLTGITALDLFTRGGNDSATFDMSANADSILAQFATSTFDGGTNSTPGDKLRLIGNGVTSSVYTPDAATTGSGLVVVTSPTQSLAFSFLALEPVDFTGMAEAKLVTPATATDADVLVVAEGLDGLDGLVSALVVSGTVGGVAIETGHFFGNQSVVIVTGSGVDGNDSISVLGAANAHGNANLSIDTGPLGQDSVQIAGNVTLPGQLSVSSGVLTIQSIVTLSGAATLSTRGDTAFGVAGRLLASHISITAGGAISMADGALVDAGAGTIALIAAGNITLGRLVTTNSTAAAVSINSTGGSVIDSGDSGGPNIVAEALGSVVTITAAQSVGSVASPLDLAVRNLVVSSGGDQYLNEIDDLASLNLNAASAAIHLTAGAQIQDADGAIDVAASTLVLTAASAGTVASPLQTQLAQLNATLTGGNLHLVESDGMVVAMATALAGDVSLRTLAGNLSIQTIQAQGLVTLAANAGAILSGAGGTNVTAASLEMQAPTGIGTSLTPLQTAVAKLEAAGGTGGVFVVNTGNLQVGGISPALLGLTGISASSSDIVLDVIGNLTTIESITTNGAGTIDLSVSADMLVQAAIASQAGAIDLLAQRSLSITGATLSSTSGPISLVANPAATPAAGTFSGIDLSGATISSASGNITLQGQGGAGGGHGILLSASSVGQTGSGDVLLAGSGTLGQADTAWDTLTLAKSGGVYTFQDTVHGGQLIVQPGPYQVRFLDGGMISQAVNFQNTGGVVLGNQDSDVLTFSGGLTSTAGPTTIQGTVATTGTDITLGATTLVSIVTLLTSGGDVTAGQISGAGVPLTINAGNGDVTLANPANVIGDLTISAGALTLFENDNITQAGAWTTIGPTIVDSGSFAILLTNPANQFGPLSLSGGSITIVESGDTELSSVTWLGLLNATASGHLLVTGAISGSGTAELSAAGNVTFAPAASIVSPTAANVSVSAGGAISMADGTLIDTGAGTIALTSAGNITLGRLVTTNSTASAVSVLSTGGSIIDSGDSGGPNIVAESLGAVVTLTAAQSVGSAGGPLDLAVRNLVVSSGGDQYLNELDDLSSLNLNAAASTIWLTTGGHIQDGDGAVDLTALALVFVADGAGTRASPLQSSIDQLEAAVGVGGLHLIDVGGLVLGGLTSDLEGVQSSGGNIKIAASGSILVAEDVRADLAGQIDLSAGDDITLDSLVSSQTGNITLSAADDLLTPSLGGLATTSGTILLLADSTSSGGGTIQFVGNIDVGSGQVIFQFPDLDGLLAGIVEGSGGLVKQGPGTLTIAPTSVNTYTGTTQLQGGTLRVDGVIGASGVAGIFTLAPGTTLTGGGDVNAPIFSTSTTAKIVSLGDLALGDGTTTGFDFAGTLLVSPGDNVTLRDADLARLGILTSIAADGQLTALSGVEVGSGERLAGFGAVDGNIVVLAGGSVTPGASPGVVSTSTGNLTLFADSIYFAEVNGSLPGAGHDQINVQGGVDLNGAVLTLSAGSFRPRTGDIFTLIENDGSDSVAGQFRGLAEGATVRFGGIEATISYKGGTGNDVTLTVTDLRIIRSPTPDGAVIVRNDTGGGGTTFTQRTITAPLTFSETARPVTLAQGTDARPQSLDTRAVERLRVFLKIVDEVTGLEEGEPVPLDPRIIDDVQGFLQRYRFPNGRYRIYLHEAGRSARLIIDISIRDGRAITPDVSPAPAAAPASVPQAEPAPSKPLGASGLPSPARTTADQIPTMYTTVEISDNVQLAEGRTAASGVVTESTAGPERPVHRWSAAAASLSAGLAVAASAPLWRDRVSKLLADPGRLPRTRFSRRNLRSAIFRKPPT